MTKINATQSEYDAIIRQILQNAQYTFQDKALLKEALTHPSFAKEQKNPCRDNQRLEFLGDAVLQIILSDLLFHSFPDEQEGVLTRIRSLLADETANAQYTRKLGLDAAVFLGKGEATTGGRNRQSILGDLFEAFLGAIYLDGGIEPARALVRRLIRPLDQCRQMLAFNENPKGALQSFCLEHFRHNVEYRTVAQDGPPHDPIYTVQAFLEDKLIGEGVGHSKKEAERNAAGKALVAIADAPEHSESKTEQTPAACEGDSGFTPVTFKPEKRTQSLILALDFDGVICDSAAETAASAWRVARDFWPRQFPEQEIPAAVTDLFRRSRPYLETGFQAVPMLKCLLDGKKPDFFADGFKTKIQDVLNEANIETSALIKAFGAARDAWISHDLDAWVALHGMYPGTVEALKAALAKHKVFILTTKQERFVSAILNHHGIDFPEAAIFGLDRKISKETELAALVGAKKTNIHFVEDRIETLRRIEANPVLKRVKLHYAPWGYGTPEHLEIARNDKRIDILSLSSFAQLLG